MAVSISLVTSFSFPSKREGQFTLPAGMETVGDLLAHLGRELEYSLLSPRGDDIDEDLEVSLNGRGLWAYPGGLATPLRQGDAVEINMLALGGG